MTAPATIFIVDDDASVRIALGRLLSAAEYEVQGFASAREFLAQTQLDASGCLLVDLQMPEMNGLELQSTLAARNSTLPVIFITGHGDFLTKPVDEGALLRAIGSALQRQNQTIAERDNVAALRCRFDALSPREREVMRLVVSGLLNKQIAAQLGISEKTVKVHRARVMEKTGSRSLAELVRLCAATGNVPDGVDEPIN